MADAKNTDQEFEGFENLDDTFTDPAADDALLDDNIDDAEFQDVADTLDDDVFEDDTQPIASAKPKKKINWFNIIVALVAVLGAGGLILSKLAPQLLSGGSNVPVEMAAPGPADAGSPASAEAAAQAAIAPQTDGTGAPAKGGMLDNPDAFAQLAQGATPAPAPAPSAIPDPFAAMDNGNKKPAAATTPVVPSAPVATGAELPMPSPITAAVPAPAESAPSIPAAPVAAVDAAPVMPATTTPVSVAADTAVESGAVTALRGQVDTLSTRMDTIETKLDTALAAVTKAQTQPVAAPADDSRFEAIQNVLARLESRLDDMSNARKATPVRVSDASDDERPVPVRHTSKKSIPAKARKSGDGYDDAYKASSAVIPVSTGSSSNGGWALRGAQPGQAIIGQGGDIRQVGVGDSVKGIGQVTGIASLNGRWVVQGTQGRIEQ